MSRSVIKTISTKLEKFVPTCQDKSLDENAPNIADRPLVAYWRKLSREDRFNISSLVEKKDVDETMMIRNMGTVARYIWDNCVIELCNVLLEEGPVESVKGIEKNRLFNTEGMDEEIAEIIRHVQDNSIFTESEVKN